MAENQSLNMHSAKLQRMLQAQETVKKVNEAKQAQEEDIKESQPVQGDDDDGPQVAGEATSAMNDVLDLHRNESEGTGLEELVSSLNTDQSRVYERIKAHLEHQVMHECNTCQCKDLKPLHMFVSGVGGTGKSFLIKTIRALVAKLWESKSKAAPPCVQSLHQLDSQPSTWVESPSTGCCSSP